MKLYLAVAVLMLAFAAQAEAQQDDTLANFGTKVKEVTLDMGEKVKTAFEEVHNSDFAVNTRKWFAGQFDAFLEQYQRMTSNLGN
ncbi:apolipoprotein C-I [Myripristis murdjan]|uniref:Apolipoprotein C-I-like n=1 Tax=Myripristis murdjan TaxID=586833 RepID=A0A667YDZ3_9TELE|nr:apolipoprotein C-I-like [Myripristis murdjan]